MQSPAKSFCGIQLFLSLAMIGCASQLETPPVTAQGNSKAPSPRSVQTQANKKKSSEISAVEMKDWECEISDEQRGDPVRFVEDAQQWSQLWTRWQPDKPVPFVDFKIFVVSVSIHDAGDPNRRGYTFFRNPDGTIRPRVISTCLGYQDTDRSKIQFHVLERN